MAFEIKTSITINASKEVIWNTLTDFNSFPQWNPFIKSITNMKGINEKFNAEIQNMKFAPVLLTYNKSCELKWKGKLIFPGIFDGEHRFQIIKITNEKCQFIHSEKFSGILVPLFKNKLNTETKSGFELMNQKLKERCENVTSVV